MPQNSVAYAVARVHVVGKDALDASRLERLFGAPTYEEALRALAEVGFTGAEGATYEEIAEAHVQKACALVRSVSPCPEATDCFLLRYDALNLKTLLKARCLGQRAKQLSACGIYPVDLLSHAVADRSYKKLPAPLSEALLGLEKKLAVAEDALLIDLTVDRAVAGLIQEKLKGVSNQTVRGYFAARSDMLGALSLLRIKRMGRDFALFREALLPGGTIGEAKWAVAFEKPETIGALLETYGRRVKQAALSAAQDAEKLPALEKAMDDALLSGFTPFRRSALSLEPVIGYLLGAEREAAAVRLILAGKANGFSPEAIRERLRDLYGGR